jgi:hypothetical protein
MQRGGAANCPHVKLTYGASHYIAECITFMATGGKFVMLVFVNMTLLISIQARSLVLSIFC